jgi:predicted ATP-binding protein involved in virulence
MNIDRLSLKNYRCFDAFELNFHPQMTVIVARNGQGKTSVLDAIKVALWPFVSGFDMGSTTKDVTGIAIDDVLREQGLPHEMAWRLPVEISASGRLQVRQLVLDGMLKNPSPEPQGDGLDVFKVFHEDVVWQGQRYRESMKKNTKTKERTTAQALSLNASAKALEQRIFSGEAIPPDDLPFLGYYGTGRLHPQKSLTAAHDKADSETQSRTFAYRDCLDPSSSYKHFAVWFSRVHQAYLQAQISNLEKGWPLDAEIPYGLKAPFKAVQQAVDAVVKPHTGWHTLQYSAAQEELVMSHAQQGELKVSQLSDGIRNMLALVGDIAYRCYKLNAHLGELAAQKTHGIVLIDEVDMHLHPGWQQTVLTDLTSAFPRLQFIVTTHSPQVLTSVDAACIRLLHQATHPETGRVQMVATRVSQQTKGVASADVLAQIMDVNPVPDVAEARDLSQYHALIQQNLHEGADGSVLKAKLEQHFGLDHPVMRDCERMIRLQAFKQRLPMTSAGA